MGCIYIYSVFLFGTHGNNSSGSNTRVFRDIFSGLENWQKLGKWHFFGFYSRVVSREKIEVIRIFRSSLPKVFCKKGVLRNCAKLTGKHLYQSPFFYIKSEAFNFNKKETLAQAFSCEFCEISKKTFSYRRPPGLLLLSCLKLPFLYQTRLSSLTSYDKNKSQTVLSSFDVISM